MQELRDLRHFLLKLVSRCHVVDQIKGLFSKHSYFLPTGCGEIILDPVQDPLSVPLRQEIVETFLHQAQGDPEDSPEVLVQLTSGKRRHSLLVLPPAPFLEADKTKNSR